MYALRLVSSITANEAARAVSMRRAIHYCVRFHSFLYSRTKFMSDAPSSERASSLLQCSGYCVGSTRREFVITTSAAAAAIATIAAVHSAARAAHRSAAVSPVFADAASAQFDSTDNVVASSSRRLLVTRSVYHRPVDQYITDNAGRTQRDSFRRKQGTVRMRGHEFAFHVDSIHLSDTA